MSYQRGIYTATPRYAGAPGQAPGGNQKKNGKPVMVTGDMGLIDEYVRKQMAELKETMAQKKYVNKKSCKKNESRHAEKIATLLSTAITDLVRKSDLSQLLEDGAPRSSKRAVNYDSSDSDSE